MDGLWLTTIRIWTAEDPETMDIRELAREAMIGEGYLGSRESEWLGEYATSRRTDESIPAEVWEWFNPDGEE